MKNNELYQLLEQSEADFKNDRTLTFEDSIKRIKEDLENTSQNTTHNTELD